MPMLPMGCTEFPELELEQQHNQELEMKPLKNAAARRAKAEFGDPSSPRAPQLGIRAASQAKFKKPLIEPGHSPSWLAMMEGDAAGFLLGHQQQHHQQHHQHQININSSTQANTATTAGINQNITGELQKKSSHVVKKVAESPSTSSRKYFPAPYCSCTGTNQQCYRWGNGGWQSACCTTKISLYPLPMNPKKKGSRVAGRKMSAGAFMKLLDRLSAEGVDVSASVDLRPHWAKHGTNRYVTIK